MRHKKLYSLFEKQGETWVRISVTALHKDQAIRMFQNALLAPYLGTDQTCKGIRELRVVKENNT